MAVPERALPRPDRALVVGIDRYCGGHGGAPFGDLAGAVADAERVAALIAGRGCPRLDVLTAPVRGVGRGLRPTYRHLVAAWKGLAATTRSGEQVLVYFAGHGGRVRSRTPGKVHDETLVPADVGDPGARHLRDVELLVMVRAVVDRGAFLTLILDACHSGGAVARTATVRGRGTVDDTARPEASLVAAPADLAAAWQRWHRPRRDLRVGSGWLPDPRGYVLLAACRENELAYEVPIATGGSGGVFTHALLASLFETAPAVPWADVAAAVCARVHRRFPAQSPVVEGERDRRPFGCAGATIVPRAIRVLAVAGDRLELDVGVLHGVRRGTRLGLAISTGAVAGEAGSGAPPPRWAIDELAAATCWARPVASGADAPSAAVVVGDRLEEVAIPEAMRTRLALDLPAAEAAALRRQLAAGDAYRLLAPTDRSDGDAALSVGFDGRQYTVVAAPADRERLPAAMLEAVPMPISDPPRLATALLHLARLRLVHRFGGVGDGSPCPLAAGLVTLEGGWAPGRPLPDIDDAGRRQRLEVEPGAWLCLELGNPTRMALNVAVLDLRPSGAVAQLFPNRRQGPCLLFEAGCRRRLPISASLPAGLPEGVDRLRVFAALEPFDLGFLELPPLATAGVRSHRPGDDEIEARLARPRAGRGSAEPGGGAPATCWSVDLEVRIGAPPAGLAGRPRGRIAAG